MFSIHEPETGRAIWLKKNQMRNGYAVNDYNPSTQTAQIQQNGEYIELTLSKSDDSALPIQFSPLQLSEYNRELLQHHKQLILHKDVAGELSSESAQKLRRETLQTTASFKTFLMSNPSVEDVNKHLGALADQIDYAALMKIKPPAIESRNAYNTAGWGIKKNVDFELLEKTLTTNPSIEVINKIIRAD